MSDLVGVARLRYPQGLCWDGAQCLGTSTRLSSESERLRSKAGERRAQAAKGAEVGAVIVGLRATAPAKAAGGAEAGTSEIGAAVGVVVTVVAVGVVAVSMRTMSVRPVGVRATEAAAETAERTTEGAAVAMTAMGAATMVMISVVAAAT